MLVGFGGLFRNQLKTLLGPIVGVLDLVAMRDGYFLQFVHSIADRRGLPPYIPLTRKRVEDECYRARFVTVPGVAPGVAQRLSWRGGRTLRRSSGLLT